MQTKTLKLRVEIELTIDEDVEFNIDSLYHRLNEFLKDYRRGEICINRLVEIEEVI